MRLIRILKYDLAREAAGWVEDNIISTNQAETICARYGADYHNSSNQSRGYQVLMGLGYLFLGLAMITLIGANWEQISRELRMSGLVGLTLGANLLGLFRFRADRKSAAVGWFFLGSLFYGASIMLIAQIYHIGEHFPDGIFWWAAGVLPIGLLLQSALIMTLATALGFIWFFVESSLNFYPALFVLFPAGIAWFLSWRKQSNLLFLALIAATGLWMEYTLAWFLEGGPGFNPGMENIALGAGLFIGFHGLSKWLSAQKKNQLVDYGVLLGIWTLRFALFSLFVLSFSGPWDEMIQAEWHLPSLAFFLSAIFSFLGIALAYKARTSIASTLAFGLLFLVSFIIVMVTEDPKYDSAFQVVYNIVLVATGTWLIIRGIRDNISHYFFLGVLTILITGLLRYIDLVGDYIGAALLFAGLAAILLYAARFWRTHQKAAGDFS